MNYSRVKFLLFTVAIVITGLWAKLETVSNLYSSTMVITDIDVNADTVTITDANGYDWLFTGIEDYQVDDVVSVLMNNNGTVSITDDSIENVKFSGFSKKF